MMEENRMLQEFSLIGGPFHRLGCRFGLVRGSNTVPLGLALGVIMWGVLAILAFFEGGSDIFFSLTVIGIHVRLLVVIPLFFLCESQIDQRMAAFVRTIVRSEIVARQELPALEYEIMRIRRWKDSRMPDAVALLAAGLLSWFASQMHITGTTAAYDPSHVSIAAFWYWIVCLTLFRFLIARWLWRLALWSFFLWRVSKLDIRLLPTHPDGSGGLGYLEVVHTYFMPLVLAISVSQSAMMAEELSTGKTVHLQAIYPALAMILLVDALLFLGPLLIFVPKLWACRLRGLSDYMEFASRYVTRFDRKWLGPDAPPKEPLLGTSDLQSLADLINTINTVRNMKWIPISLRLLRDMGLVALLPFLPLLLFKYPVVTLAEKFFTMLTGL